MNYSERTVYLIEGPFGEIRISTYSEDNIPIESYVVIIIILDKGECHVLNIKKKDWEEFYTAQKLFEPTPKAEINFQKILSFFGIEQ